MAVKHYDSESYKLAEHFLWEEPSRVDDPAAFERLCDSLALDIQQAVEDWLFDRERDGSNG